MAIHQSCMHPPRVSAPKGELVKFFYESLKTETDDCILWIYAKLESGYGVLTVNGKSHKAHRLALSLSTPQPPNKPFALHNCLSKSCFNPRHLRWGDDTDNMRDRIKDGTSPRGRKHGLNKLSEDDIRAIREDTRSQVLIAKEYKVNQTNISAIKTGKSWAWL